MWILVVKGFSPIQYDVRAGMQDCHVSADHDAHIHPAQASFHAGGQGLSGLGTAQFKLREAADASADLVLGV